jgi:hypothetical protein
MASAFEKVALYSPVIASSVPFAMRRTKRGIDAMDDNPYFGTANIIIAGGQTLKAVRAAKDMTFTQTQSAAETIKAANATAKGFHTTSKFLNIMGKVFDFTSKHINPLICCASGIKVLGSDDKVDAAIREGCGLLGMLGIMEPIGKKLLDMPKNIVDTNGVVKTVPMEIAHDNNHVLEKHIKTFVNKQTKALEDYCQTKKLFNKISLKPLPGVAKGLAFVFLFSVPGYKLGQKGAELILGKEKCKNSDQNQCQYVQMSNTPEQSAAVQAA